LTKDTYPDPASRDAWQKGYDSFQADQIAGGDVFQQLLDQLPAHLHKPAFDGWTVAIADWNTAHGKN
jgi:hypothetical protein